MATGFFTDTTLCIGCKACEVACKQWNQLPADGYRLSGNSYDNTLALGATTWRHVAFVEQEMDGKQILPVVPIPLNVAADGGVFMAGFEVSGTPDPAALQAGKRWLMMSDVCKHCTNAGCLHACPTGAIIRNEFDAVYVQPDICNGCGYCVPSCPFGVIELHPQDGRAFKCTLCYDRQKDGLEPACAKACPTDSIQFGDLDELKEHARQRVTDLHERGVTDAYLYGVDEKTAVGDLNAFFLLVDEPQVYGLPVNPPLPQNSLRTAYLNSLATAALLTGVAVVSFLRRRKENK
jgi:formate dehydrogenase iron-sulfur subunit